MFNFFPVGIEFKLGAVIEIVTLKTGILFGFGKRDSHDLLRFFELIHFDQLDMAAAGTVAVLALLAQQMGRIED